VRNDQVVNLVRDAPPHPLDKNAKKNHTWFSLTTQQTVDLGAYPYTQDLLALAQATPTQMQPLLPQNLV